MIEIEYIVKDRRGVEGLRTADKHGQCIRVQPTDQLIIWSRGGEVRHHFQGAASIGQLGKLVPLLLHQTGGFQ